MRFLPALLLTCTALFAKDPIVATDLLKIKQIAAVDVSHDGRTAVYIVRSAYGEPAEGSEAKGELKYGYRQHLWRLDLTTPGSKPVQLTYGDRNDGNPTIAPDGKSVAFVRVENKKPQVWIMPLGAPGEAHVVTRLENGAAQPVWRPDSGALLVSSAIPISKIDRGAEGKPYYSLERPGRDWFDTDAKKANPDGSLQEIRDWLDKNSAKNDPVDINRINFLAEQGLEEEERVVHLFLIEVATGKSTELTKGFRSYAGCAFAPDAAKLVCGSEPDDTTHPDRVEARRSLWMVPLDGSAPRVLLQDAKYAFAQPRFTADGKTLLMTVRQADRPMYRQARLARANADGGKLTFLTKDGDTGVQQFVIASDGRSAMYTVQWHGGEPLRKVALDGGAVADLIGGPIGVNAFAEGGGNVVFAEIALSDPNELYSMQAGGKTTQITELNSEWLRNKELSVPVEKWITRPDGLKVQMWVMNPIHPLAGKKYPWVLDIHGGPSAMWGPGELSMWHEFQILCSFGYGVVYSNPRGSGGYGYDFQQANYQNWGEKPSGDVLAALDEAVKDNALVDANRLFITGGSYAGYLTAWIIGHDQRFKAAVAQRGVYDLATFFGEANAFRLVQGEFGGYPWEPETKKLLERESPFTYVQNIRTPFLIIHGSQDLRTGIAQSEMMFKALKIMGRPVEYLRYPAVGHELTRSGPPNQRMDHMLRIIEFFERYSNNDAHGPTN